METCATPSYTIPVPVVMMHTYIVTIPISGNHSYECCNIISTDSSFILEEDEDVIIETEPQAPPPIPRHQGGSPSRPPKPVSPVEAVDPSVPQQLPPLDRVHLEIKVVTICIQELLKAGQAQQQGE